FTGATSAIFSENEDDATDDPETAVVDVADEIRDILEDNDVTLSEIKDAFVTSMSYGVVSFDQSHDWSISGAISVRRNDDGLGTETFTSIANYTSVSVQGALGQKIAVPLEPGGVAVINQALDDFLAGGNPVLEFQILNDTIAPPPSGVDPMVFNWRAWLTIQLITTETVDVPDPF
ncbi:MAG TPA: hypothetical protein VFU38_07170, partial [Candidatus Krumholzibacteria bacterium]|nr:hypothetical protein [Candidatus Krumholzibacteria bacterium]